jgi:hypothetical protein
MIVTALLELANATADGGLLDKKSLIAATRNPYEFLVDRQLNFPFRQGSVQYGRIEAIAHKRGIVPVSSSRA